MNTELGSQEPKTKEKDEACELTYEEQLSNFGLSSNQIETIVRKGVKGIDFSRDGNILYVDYGKNHHQERIIKTILKTTKADGQISERNVFKFYKYSTGKIKSRPRGIIKKLSLDAYDNARDNASYPGKFEKWERDDDPAD